MPTSAPRLRAFRTSGGPCRADLPLTKCVLVLEIYEWVEVLRGPAGLLSGAGGPRGGTAALAARPGRVGLFPLLARNLLGLLCYGRDEPSRPPLRLAGSGSGLRPTMPNQ